LRRCLENESAGRLGAEGRIYVPSFSIRTIVYKGLMLAPQVARFYPDLGAPDLVSALCVVHQRYSTNTFPSWELAQPFRYLAHNGEINTLRGNLNWMRSREPNLASPLLGDDLAKLLPVIDETGSDSACLDNALELLVAGGRSLCHALLMLIPQAWGAKYPMGPDLRGFFDYHAGLMEPWDGPAAVAFSDGRAVGALLDPNGLRPARYTLTHDGFMVFASEAGVLDIPARQVKAKGALRPGQMLLADLGRQRLLLDTEIKMRLARAQPYRRWVEENKIMIHGFFDAVAPVRPDTESLSAHQRLFGYTREDLKMVLDPMASTEQEPVGSMGADEALAIFSEKPQLLYWYFKQTFAQVTNPAIDPIREELVMSLMTFIGTPDNILAETPEQAHLLKLNHPVLSNDDLTRIRGLNLDDFACKTLSLGMAYPADGARLAAALEELGAKAEAALRAGYRIVILSDKDLPVGELPMPALLAVAAVNRHLVRVRLRTRNGLLLETGEAREVQHLALLLGYGASAINPYLAFETVADMAQREILRAPLSVPQAIENYTHALCKGLLKVMSKSGISTLRSYRNAQVFEAVGLNSDVINAYFSGTPSRIEGIGLEEIAAEANARYAEAYVRPEGAAPILPPGGHYALRADGERHLWTPESIHALQRATRENDFERYRQYAGLINEQARNQCTLRGLMAFKAATPIPLEEVEPVEALMKRFVTGAMSYGSISLEAHETLAIAMNRIGGKSNSGEGGEDRARYQPDANGDSRASAIKQIASGRFGVTAEYLAHGQDLQIKIAQGAKPGEGGQLPGFKVNAEIARTRHSTPGVTLISPPPHHDIYSIEDIAQLIYDLKCANPEARISVKLVSRAGVGTVAAGVAKARSDVILISGYDGGTGASPLSSLKHAGTPWELGLAEAQQTLVLNGLRNRVILQVDGQIKTGRDVIIGALLGAEEFGFATAALVVCGCVMMRKCHKNTCPVGIATQDAELRKRYTGQPEHVVNYLRFVAQEARELMAQLGVRRLDDLVGASERLEMSPALRFWKARGLDYSKILYQPAVDPAARRAAVPQQHGLESALDYELLPAALPAIEKRQPVVIERPIRNVHRTVGTILSSRIAKRYGLEGLPDDTLTLLFTGSAGQSFGAFCSRGMTLELTGEANDYLAKGLSGARVVVKPWPDAAYDPAENIIAGNVILYGATSGACYINGAVGERFAIRNSGALAVVEGVGDHGCEYMTGGRVVILGPTGVNFAAGMSGGIAYVYDESGLFDARCNLGMVDLETVAEPAEQDELRGYLEQHVQYTGSARAAGLLADWQTALPYFVKVFPMEYKKVLGYLSREDLAIKRPETPNN
ncbi:MAG: glutamate synthase large subunit, partial [Candidatus Marinimicrobia bacterium]|nr:glutamate synthase large subunit [Candidatus Neomarinimicrobiota bacterium]